MPAHIAIIGAGLAGLAAARRIRQARPEIALTIYERAGRPGGRAATVRRDGFAFDHGAQYLKAATPAITQLITAELPSDDLFDIARPVWVFDRSGAVAEGDPAQNADPKWSYRAGLDTLPALLAEGLDLRCGAEVAALARTGPRWQLRDPRGALLGEADALLLTAPAPQAAQLIAASALGEPLRGALLAGLAPAAYRRCLSVALAYPYLVHRPFYALVNTDRGHPISWVALEHAKGPQRCPPGHSLLIAQLAPAASAERWDAPPAALAPAISALLSDLLAEDLGEPLWADCCAWPWALPDGRSDPAALAEAAAAGLHLAGDHTAGQGRLHLAIEQGWLAADRILSHL